ncbi:hypothetical protein JOC37_000361 [Desulfohalotomaculum tongense]|uniref:hypothetical protein n=1 Tax=Desulforadius tongensis TaxID=1216062 RepID=UPI00195D9E4B|nr:hypothetical protein [Desulforadius tongensis]MBM7853989.1 hypothetical protein [Desulforadius tongensis]
MIINKKDFNIGLIMLVIFLGLFVYMWTPAFDGKNAFQFSDQFFNSIAKGSSYRIPALLASAEDKMGKEIQATISADDAESAQKVAILYQKAGADVVIKGEEIQISGDLGKITTAAILDADAMYDNNGKYLIQKYGFEPKEIMYYWWHSYGMLQNSLQKVKEFKAAAFLNEVTKKAVEPGYNFYGIQKASAGDNMALLSGLLAFYVFYTLLWGFAIYYLCNGIGILMSKK